MNIQTAIHSASPQQSNYAQDFHDLWMQQTKKVNAQGLTASDYALAFDLARKIRSDAPDIQARYDITNTLHHTRPTWQHGLKSAIPDLSLSDINTILEHSLKFNISFDNITFKRIEDRVNEIACADEHTNLVKLVHFLSHHSWTPSPKLYDTLSAHITPDILLHDAFLLRIFLRAAVHFDVASDTPSPLAPIAQQAFDDTLKKITKPRLLKQFTRTNFQATWHYGSPDITQNFTLNTRGIHNSVSREELSLKNLFGRYADTTPDTLLSRFAKHSDIALKIKDTIVHIEFDGSYHFLNNGSPIYNGTSILNAALCARLHPDCVFIHLPYREAHHKVHLATDLITLLQSSKMNRLRNRSPLMLLNRNGITLNPFKSPAPYLRHQNP